MGPTEKANLCSHLQVAGQPSDVQAVDLSPFIAKTHDRVSGGGDVGPSRAREAPTQDGFNFLPINHLDLATRTALTPTTQTRRHLF